MSINKWAFIGNCNRKDLSVTLCNSISSCHNFETKCSWLIYYFGKTFTIELDYPIVCQKMNEISAAAMW